MTLRQQYKHLMMLKRGCSQPAVKYVALFALVLEVSLTTHHARCMGNLYGELTSIGGLWPAHGSVQIQP